MNPESTARDWARQSAENLQAMELYHRLLQPEGPLFTPGEVTAFARDCDLPEESAFPLLLSAACGLSIDESPEQMRLYRRYLLPALRPLDPAPYLQNPYARAVRFPEQSEGAWRYARLSYAPYQLFPCGNTALLPDGREIQPLGYFTVPFSYPAVLENEREWMTLTPNEIETMREDISAARGRVAMLGLGLGYAAFMAAQKREVSQVTVVERDEQVISLFRAQLLPQFPEGNKIRLIHADAFDFLSAAPPDAFDFVYADLWHDVADGLPLYLRLRKLEESRPGAEFRYWIEPSLLIFLRELLLEDWLRRARRLDRLLPREADALADALTLNSVRALCRSIAPEDV